MKLGNLFLAILVVSAVGCAHTDDATIAPPCPDDTCPRTNENLDATLWVQTAAEYEALSLQTYEMAKFLATRGLSEPAWTALDGVTVLGKSPAIIVDVDETVLDNSAYQARLILDDASYGRESWKAWVEEAKADPVPGADEFAQWAAKEGITIFYVTNRRSDEEPATRANLAALGFPLRDDIDTVLTRGEREEWASDKTNRRGYVAGNFRVLLLIGDDLGDFVPRSWNGIEGRREIIEANRDKWGSKWLVIPNPTYGSWMGAIVDQGEEGADRMKILYDALEPKR